VGKDTKPRVIFQTCSGCGFSGVKCRIPV